MSMLGEIFGRLINNKKDKNKIKNKIEKTQQYKITIKVFI